MKNFIEWCKEKGLSLESNHTEPVKKAKKVSDTNKYSGKVHKTADEFIDYKGHFGHNGTADPLDVKTSKGKGGAVADVGK